MCGIVGIVDPNADLKIGGMLERISHRGPDDRGTFHAPGFSVGQQRLAIQDLSENGHQPMISDDGRYVLVFNGEIYNHWEIREKIKEKYSFRSTSDTETILYGFIEYGVDLFNQLNGIFAFSIYDTLTNDLIIVRDQFGVKPLYYYQEGDTLCFASELKSISHLGVKKELNYTALFNYLYFLWSPADGTPVKSISKLLAGHFIKLNIKAVKDFEVVKYYEVPFDGNYSTKTELELIDELDLRMQKAVQRQMLSDVPVGFFLSGGLDSSIIVAMAKKQIPDLKTKCFTIETAYDSKREGFANDLPYAVKVADYLNVDLEIVKADIDILSDFDKMIWHLDEPQADPAPLNVLNITKRARELGYVVLLGGTAGDDLFSGYRRHQQLYFDKKLRIIPGIIKRAIDGCLSNIKVNNSLTRRLKKFFAVYQYKKRDEQMASLYGWLTEEKVFALFSDNAKAILRSYDPKAFLIDSLRNIPKEKNSLNQMLFWDIKYFLTDHNLNYTDKMSMANGIEVRVPFLDKELLEFSAIIPPNMKMKGKTTKYILKKVAERYLPMDVIYRPKSGFGAPVRDWIVNDLDEKINQYLSKENIEKRGVFDFDEVSKLIKDNKLSKVDSSYTIWALLSIESWCQQFID